MHQYRSALPQLSGKLFLTDGGIETTLIFHDGLELPDFAAFDLLKDKSGRAALKKYFCTYAELASKYRVGLILESATWRANADWGSKLGYSATELARFNLAAIELLLEVRDEFASAQVPIVLSGCVGPRGDGYSPTLLMSPDQAQLYHQPQIDGFRDSAADVVTAITMNYPDEATGIARAAVQAGLPVVISFTVETDGRLPSGETLQQAIESVDDATTHAPVYYMINCAHPRHFEQVLATDAPWTKRIRGLRANASTMSHAELNDSTELDIGDPQALGRDHGALLRQSPHINVLGGCCGTDHRHIEEICRAVLPYF